MLLESLYTEPPTINPIHFHPGVNIILGEGDTTSAKNNGVGKSLCIEFINFGLLKRRHESRINKVPETAFDKYTFICVQFLLNGDRYIIKRSLHESENPRIIHSGGETIFSKLDDAITFLTEKMFFGFYRAPLSFREIIGLLIRDERSEFKSIVSSFDTKLRVPDNYAPHLNFLNVDVEAYRSVRSVIKEIDAITDEEKRIRDNVTSLRQKKFKEARLDLNKLAADVAVIQNDVDNLENSSTYNMISNEFREIESELSRLRLRRRILDRRINNLLPSSLEPSIDTAAILNFFNLLKENLGSIVARDLSEIISFKEKILHFQNHILSENSQVLDDELRKIDSLLSQNDTRYSKLLSALDQQGALRALRQTYAAYQIKLDELGQLKGFFNRYDQLAFDKQNKRAEREAEIAKLQASIQAARDWITHFEKTIRDIHQYIQGNRSASFEVAISPGKQVVDLVMRINDDGGHSLEREKVFIYDISLLLNEFTRSRHPGLLIHDNIFDVDDDTLKQNLSFLLTKANFGPNQQYILTLNIDRLENCL